MGIIDKLLRRPPPGGDPNMLDDDQLVRMTEVVMADKQVPAALRGVVVSLLGRWRGARLRARCLMSAAWAQALVRHEDMARGTERPGWCEPGQVPPFPAHHWDYIPGQHLFVCERCGTSMPMGTVRQAQENALKAGLAQQMPGKGD